jgi:hypothetical protein
MEGEIRMVSTQELEAEAFAAIARCRGKLAEDDIDMSELTEPVRRYCEHLGAIAREEAMEHMDTLKQLMEEVTLLRASLTDAQQQVSEAIGALPQVRRAHVAYQKSDAIAGEKPPYPREDE